jgi:hypothetical protein
MAYVTPQLALVGEAIKTVLGSSLVKTVPQFEYPDGDGETYNDTPIGFDEETW